MCRAKAPFFYSRCLPVLLAGLLACQDNDAATAPDGPALRVKLFYVGGRQSANLRVSARTESISESAIVGSSNEVVLGSRLLSEDSVEIRVEEPGPATRRFHPSIAIVTRADLGSTQKFVLVPRRWTITGGVTSCRYTGQTVDIDLELAYTRSLSDLTSFYWRTPGAGGGWTYRTATFPASALPLAVAFNHASSTDPISEADSVAFWRTVTELESELCANVFQPATMTAMTPGRGVMVMVDRELDAGARGGPNSGVDQGATVLVGGVVICRTVSCISSGETIRHELMHVLGFGHSCSWPTIMRAGCVSAPRASEWDVAYYQVYYAARELQLATGAQHSLAAAHQGERVILKGLPIEPAMHVAPLARSLIVDP